MIRLLQTGTYKIIERAQFTILLTLNDDGKEQIYEWIQDTNNGETLVLIDTKDKTGEVILTGKYRLYEVKDEQSLTDLLHLELLVGEGIWRAYILPTAFLSMRKEGSEVIPTEELITKSTH